MMTEIIREPDWAVADFHAKVQSDTERQWSSDPSKSFIKEIEKLQAEITTLRDNVQQLCQAVRGLVQLQAIANQKLDSAIKGNADCAVL
jgi:uncharacterized protein (UPF0335 family)